MMYASVGRIIIVYNELQNKSIAVMYFEPVKVLMNE